MCYNQFERVPLTTGSGQEALYGRLLVSTDIQTCMTTYVGAQDFLWKWAHPCVQTVHLHYIYLNHFISDQLARLNPQERFVQKIQVCRIAHRSEAATVTCEARLQAWQRYIYLIMWGQAGTLTGVNAASGGIYLCVTFENVWSDLETSNQEMT